MPYYIVQTEIALPKTPHEFHQEFFNNMSMMNLNGELSVIGFPRRRWDMLKNYVHRLQPGSAPPGTRTLQGGYGLEAVDDRHRMPDLTAAMLQLYQKTFPPNFHAKNSLFLRWMDDFCALFPDEVITYLKQRLPGLPADTYRNFVERGVQYLDKPKSRFPFLIEFKNGKMYQMDKPFSTRNTRTHFSGAGWAIYVVSPKGLWYAGSHVVGKFQHSSFLGGRPVLAAGEMQVDDGVPKVLTAKSGHYTPTMDQFMNGLNSLKRNGVDMMLLKVVVRDTTTNQKVQHTAAAFMTNAALRNRHSVW